METEIRHDGVAQWTLPYIDQPLDFWESLADRFPGLIREVYFPLPAKLIGSGEPTQPSKHLDRLLREGPFKCSALLNPITLPRPVEAAAPAVIEELRRLIGEYGIGGATVADLNMAFKVREALPDLPLCASCLMQISKPNQVLMLNGVVDHLVPDNRIMRDLPALRNLRAAFRGRIRLLVNEGCLPGCPFRVQHFHEMGSDFPHPRSLCAELLSQQPWMRLTGGWVLPQHLHCYDGVYDDLKLGGRVTLRDPADYLRVLDAYVNRRPLPPNRLGCGPASVLSELPITEEFFARTLNCQNNCTDCSYCREYYLAATLFLAGRSKSATAPLAPAVEEL
jgi:hypothetical protein